MVDWTTRVETTVDVITWPAELVVRKVDVKLDVLEVTVGVADVAVALTPGVLLTSVPEAGGAVLGAPGVEALDPGGTVGELEGGGVSDGVEDGVAEGVSEGGADDGGTEDGGGGTDDDVGGNGSAEDGGRELDAVGGTPELDVEDVGVGVGVGDVLGGACDGEEVGLSLVGDALDDIADVWS